MKLFKCTTFEGVFPTGTAAIVIAENETAARRALSDELKTRVLELQETDVIEEVAVNIPAVYILQDGDY